MSINGIWISSPRLSSKDMAKWEIHMRFGIIDSLWWKYMPGSIITMKWPVGWVVLHENPDGSKVGTESADPNDHWRPWLEKHVGKQEWDWNWRLGRIAAFGSPAGYDTIEIKFRKAKAPQATLFRLKYSN